ncbi:MAG TPA: hypothetical protein VML96_11380 [Egibacteraceae bacterium]|nr:hypothetical protein [Egibacteraceae bacterium]
MSLVSGNPMLRDSEERHCAHPECVTVLSRYNPSGTCATHGGWTMPEEPGKRHRRHTI